MSHASLRHAQHEQSGSPVRVALVDDSDLAVAGLEALLTPYAERVELVDIREAIGHPEALDVVLYEPVSLSGMGRSLLRDLQREVSAQTAVFSWASPDQLPTPTANPHLSKNLTASQLVVRLEELASGTFVIPAPPRVESVRLDSQAGSPSGDRPGRAAVATTSRPDDRALVVLTPREIDIVERIVGGLSNREIGDELALSVNSVKTYVRSAYRKMGVERRTQAVLWGLTHGLGGDAEVLVS